MQEIEMQNCLGKIDILEGIISKRISQEHFLSSISEIELIRYFNDMTIKNIDSREEIRRKNKILLERLITIGKEYKKLKK